MRIQDLKKLEEKLLSWNLQDVKNIVICSADSQQKELLHDIFPDATISTLDRGEWNLESPSPIKSDLLIACNVFMNATNPLKWLQMSLKGTRYLVVLDMVVSHRGGAEGETSPSTGDVMRYTMPPLFTAKLPNAFDLNKIKKKISDVEAFEYESGCRVAGYDTTKMFIALLKEEKTLPPPKVVEVEEKKDEQN